MTKETEQKRETEQERLCQLLTEQSDELQQEIMAFFEAGKEQKTIWEIVRGVFKRGRKIRKRKDDVDEN